MSKRKRPNKKKPVVVTNRAIKKATKEGTGKGLPCVLIDFGGYKALIPRSVMNEVIKYQSPEAFETAPEWLLGSIDWKNWQVPVIAYNRLTGLGKEAKKASPHILVIKSLANNRQMPYIGILIESPPQNLNIENDRLVENAEAHPALGVFSSVKLAGKEEVVVPDLDRLNQLVAHAAYGALPITQI